jgi:hypothetical protein
VISNKQRRLIINSTVLIIVFIISVIGIDLSIRDVMARHLLIVGFGIGVVITVAGMAITTRTEPKAWKHVYKPQKYDSDMVPHVKKYMGQDVSPGTWSGYQERVKASIWLREAMAEYVEHTWSGSPWDFNKLMADPGEAEYLKDKPALKKMFVDMQDLGVYKEGSSLLYRRRMYLKMVDKMFQELKAQ